MLNFLHDIGGLLVNLLKLFIIGLVVIVLFKIAVGLLPILLIGGLTVYAINYFNTRVDDDEVEIVE